MENNTFILNDVKNLDKLSCHSYEPKSLRFINRLKSNGIPLSQLKEKIISGPMGFHLHTYDYVPENYPNRAKLLQVSNIDEFGELRNNDNDKYISENKNQELKSSIVKKGDLILAKTGTTIGKIAFFNEDYSANLNQALGIIRLKKNFKETEINPKYIHTFLNSFYGLEQFIFLGGYRAGQGGLSLEEITSIYIILPEKDQQELIIKDVNSERNKAIKHFNNYIDLTEESKKLPLKLLNLKMPNEEQRVYISSKRNSNRLDAIFNSPFYNELKKHIKTKPHKKLKELVDDASNKFQYNNFYKLIDLDNIDENSSKIRSFKEVVSLNSAKTTFKKNNILISKLGGEKGNIILVDKEFDGCVGSGELVPFKLKKESCVSLEYIFLILRSFICTKQMEYMLTGCSRMRISKTEMKELLIPMPKDKTEEDIIVTQISKKLKQAEKEYQNYLSKKKEMFNVIEGHIEKLLVK